MHSARPQFFFIFWPCGQKRLNYLTRMRRGSNNRETPKGVPSSKNNRQLVTCRPFRDSCMRTKPNSYRHGFATLPVNASKTLFHAYGKPFSMHTGPGLYLYRLEPAELLLRVATAAGQLFKLERNWPSENMFWPRDDSECSIGLNVHRDYIRSTGDRGKAGTYE